MISPDARIDGSVASGVSAAAFSVVAAGAEVGEGATLGEGAIVLAGATVGAHARVGAGAVVLNAVTVGHHAELRAGAVVAHDVPPYAVVAGNPARIVGYADAPVAAAVPEASIGDLSTVEPYGVRWVEGVSARDLRGALAAYEAPAQLPFVPVRAYLVYGVSEGSARGEHAHRTCDEVLVCVSGEVDVLVDTGRARAQVRLADPSRGLYLPAMTWRVLINHTPGAVLLVLASEGYDPAEYVRDHAEFEALAARR